MEWPLLSPLGAADRTAVLAAARRRRFRRGEVVFHEGDPGDTLHLVAKGRVAIRVTTPLGDEATLLVLGPGEYFGELALVSPGPRNATVVALEPVETLTLFRDDVIEVRRRHPEVDAVLFESVVAEVRRLSHLLLEALYLPVETRVLRRLVDLVHTYGDSRSGPVVIPLTQTDLAQLAGTTRPTANKVLRVLEEQAVVRIARGRIEVLDPDSLARRAR